MVSSDAPSGIYFFLLLQLSETFFRLIFFLFLLLLGAHIAAGTGLHSGAAHSGHSGHSGQSSHSCKVALTHLLHHGAHFLEVADELCYVVFCVAGAFADAAAAGWRTC